MKKIVILGAGFAGIRCALDLEKKLPNYEISIINKRPAHVFRPDLYEVATAFHPQITETCMTQLSETVAIPLNKIFANKKVKIILKRVMRIDAENKLIHLDDDSTQKFDYLVVALGSAVNDFGIEGLKTHASTLKTVTDAMELSCKIDMLFHERWAQNNTDTISFIIGGGGATGVEFAAALNGYVKKLCSKYQFPRNKVSIKIIEGGTKLAGLSEKGTTLVIKKLLEHGITVECEARVSTVSETNVTILCDKKEKNLPHSLFIWSGGVKPHPLVSTSFEKISKRGGIMVNEFLQTEEKSHIFACGDNAEILDPHTHNPVPWLAQTAIAQGALVAHNIIQSIESKPMKKYVPVVKGVVIPLGGTFAILEHNGTIVSGRSIWYLRRLIDLSYAMSILPWWYAIKKWFATNKIFAQND